MQSYNYKGLSIQLCHILNIRIDDDHLLSMHFFLYAEIQDHQSNMMRMDGCTSDMGGPSYVVPCVNNTLMHD